MITEKDLKKKLMAMRCPKKALKDLNRDGMLRAYGKTDAINELLAWIKESEIHEESGFIVVNSNDKPLLDDRKIQVHKQKQSTKLITDRYLRHRVVKCKIIY